VISNDRPKYGFFFARRLDHTKEGLLGFVRDIIVLALNRKVLAVWMEVERAVK